MRTVVYARYSSHLQNARSIEDQIADCVVRAEREGWQILDVYTDFAISGAAGISGRPGLDALLIRVKAGGVDQVLTESTDRIARHQGDDFAIREQLAFTGTRLFTLMEGEIDEIVGTFKGLMNARFRKDLGDRTRRGQRGAVAQGRAPGGLAYGYHRANKLDENGNLVRGLRVIVEDEADIIRRIFSEYASGQSPRAIAERLNKEGVPAPGRAISWRFNTILGDRQRHTGILNNRAYAGVLTYNRTRKVLDPQTRRRLTKPNPQSEWVSRPTPELRIVSDELWQAAQDRRAEGADRPAHQQRRPKHMLSGLGQCGNCGGSWVRQSHAYWGCSRRKDGRGCDNALHIRTDRFEEQVLDHLKHRLLSPDAVAAYVRAYHIEHARLAGETSREASRLDRRIGDAKRKLDRLVAIITDGGGEFSELREALSKAKREHAELVAQRDAIEAMPVIALHPGIADDYRRQVEQLQSALHDHEAAKLEAIPKLRALIDRVVLTPVAGDLQIEVIGRIAEMIGLATPATRTVRRAVR